MKWQHGNVCHYFSRYLQPATERVFSLMKLRYKYSCTYEGFGLCPNSKLPSITEKL